MKKTIKSKMFIGAMMIGFSLLLAGCSQPASGGGPTGGHQDYTDYSVSEIDANSLYYIHKDANCNANALIFSNPNWDVTYQGLSAVIIDKDPVFAKWPQYGDALVDTHGEVVMLATHTTSSVFSDGISENVTPGTSVLTIRDITVSEESALSFDYKCDLFYGYDKNGNVHRNYLKVFIDDSFSPAFETFGYEQMWQTGSIVLSAGTHSVEFVAGTPDTWYGYNITNAAYIDNITIASNNVESVEIYPKGLQETYVNGDKIQFSAKALRSDGSVISGKNITWTTTGGSIDDNGLFTPSDETGIFTVTATIESKSASNATVKVHGSNYLTEPVTINGHTFTGYISNIDYTNTSNTNNITFESPTPRYSNFTTDGFFVLKGHAKNKPVCVAIFKNDEDDTTDLEWNVDYPYKSYIAFKPGDFESRIWLRYGDGDYQIFITEASINFYKDYDGYEGASYGSWNWTGEAGSFTWFKVTNKTGLGYSPDDSAYLLPSDNCQCDDFLISNAFNSVMAELPANAKLGQKLRALYDWEAKRSHYDYVSFTNTSTTKRKRQDAVHVIKYGMCVCEGYADLYTAFARLLGVKSAFQWSEYWCHDWTELYYNDEWKMIDITWDDPSATNTIDKNPTAENYWYFLIDPDDASHAKRDSEGNTIEPYQYDRVTDYSRSVN